MEYVYEVSTDRQMTVSKFFAVGIATSINGQKENNKSFEVSVRQPFDNQREVEKKQKINMQYRKLQYATKDLIEHIRNELFEPLDFSMFERLSDEEKKLEVLKNTFIPMKLLPLTVKN